LGLAECRPVVAGLVEPGRVMVPDPGEAGGVESGVVEHPVDRLVGACAQVLVAYEQCRVPYDRVVLDEPEDVAVDRRPVHSEGVRAPPAVPGIADGVYPSGVTGVDETVLFAELVVAHRSGRGDPAGVVGVGTGYQLVLFEPRNQMRGRMPDHDEEPGVG